MSDPRRNAAGGGFALIAVLVALSLLLTLSVPFLLSMGHGEAVSQDLADAKHVELLSASARDIVLQQAARTHQSVDEDMSFDDLTEFPSELALPEAFAGLSGDDANSHLLSAEVEDLQRRINLDTASPLLIANLLGLTARISEDLDPDATKIEVGSTRGFPEEGYILVDRELIRYGALEGNAFVDLERGLLALEKGYEPAEEHT